MEKETQSAGTEHTPLASSREEQKLKASYSCSWTDQGQVVAQKNTPTGCSWLLLAAKRAERLDATADFKTRSIFKLSWVIVILFEFN